MDIKKLKKRLVYMANELNTYNISWALGASFLLYLKGFKNSVTDIDIIVDENDHEKLKKLLKPFPYTYMSENTQYQTSHFYGVEIGGIDFDFMIGFRVNTGNGIYEFPHTIEETIFIDDTPINLGSLKEWQRAYKAMNRDYKVKLIEDRLETKISTKRLLLEPMDYKDFNDMYEYMSKPYVHTFENSEPYDIPTMNRVLSYIVPSGNYYSVKLKENNKHIGHIYFALGQPERFKEYMIGYMFNESYHNKGYCTESCKELINFAFKKLDINRVKAMCNPDNIASWKVMEKIGMKKEGHLRKRVHFKNDEEGNPIWWDELIYGLTKDDIK